MKGDAYKNYRAFLKNRRVPFFEYYPIKRFSTILVGNQARIFVEPQNVEQAVFAVTLAKALGLEYYVLSGGSDTLFCGELVNTVIISTRKLVGISRVGSCFEIMAGITSGEAISYFKKQKLSALEYFVGVPSRIGGMVAMNFGCYKREISDCIVSVSAITDNGIEDIQKKDCGFSYRSSRFQSGEVVLSCKIKAEKDEFTSQTAAKILSKRMISQPLTSPTLGCAFKSDKIPVGKAVEESGLKGTVVGGAKISEKHGGFIENIGNATSEDVIKLMDIVKEKVYNDLGIELLTEIAKVF